MIKAQSFKTFIHHHYHAIFLFLAGIIILNIAVSIFLNMSRYTTPYDHSYWKIRYKHSQWVSFPAVESIGDDGLYAFQGWKMIHGDDPTLLNAEVPPLGKYLIGYTILIFKNQNIFGVFSAVAFIGAFYALNVYLFKNKLLTLLPVVLFSFEPLFLEQMQAPFLDLLYTFFFIMLFLFFLQKRYILSSFFLGLMMATKSPVSTGILVAGVCILYLVLSRSFSSLKKYILSLPISLLVLLLSYTQYFLLGHSLREFLGVQKWILVFYSSGAKGSFSTVWQMLITGNWDTWWGEILRVNEWLITWPILLISSFLGLIFLFVYYKKNTPFALVLLWIFAYFIFLMFVPVWPRYLLLALPFMYNLAVWLVVSSRRIVFKS